MDELPNRTSIDHLRQTDYMKLLEYGVAKAGRPFTREEAIAGARVSTEGFDAYLGTLYVEASRGSGQYALTIDTLPMYIGFRELDEALKGAKDAQREAITARRIAIIAIVISAVLALIQVYFQINGEMQLDAGQVRQLVQASESIEKSQATRLDAINNKVEETNKALLEMKQGQMDLLVPKKRKPVVTR
jgi:hypothetical protein